MDRSQLKTQVRLLAATLEVGDSDKSRCPSCNGGSTKEISFSVTRESLGLLYNCYRSSCTANGFVPTAAGVLPPQRKQHKLRSYYHAVLPLEQVDEDYFYERFGIHRTGEIFLSERGEYIFPIYSARSYVRGYVVRQPLWKGEPGAPRKGRHVEAGHIPKARTFPHVAEAMQSFYFPAVEDALGEGTLVVVEDQLSAIKVAQAGLLAVALLGTTVNLDKVKEWSTLGAKQVLIALDADATAEGFKIARKWGLAFPKVRVVMLQQDLKDELSEDILEVLGI